MNPVNWWHSLEGGEIAKQRPPPPGSTDAYPNLASVPAKPEAPDQKTLASITQGLVADRAHAEYLAAAAPLPDPSSPASSPALFGQGSMPPPPPASAAGPANPASAPTAPPTASATLPAASAPPRPSDAPMAIASAPRHPVQSAPLAAPTAPAPAQTASATPPGAAAPASGPPPSAAGTAANNAPLAPPGTAVVPPVASAPPPPIPAAPPAPPNLSGPGAPPVPSTMVASAEPRPAPLASNAVTVEFVPGSATLPPGAGDVLKGVATKRGQAVVAVTGYGDATSSDPDAQTAALSLGLSRAQAVANALTADGVPAASVRVGAEAGGRGASVRLVQ